MTCNVFGGTLNPTLLLPSVVDHIVVMNKCNVYVYNMEQQNMQFSATCCMILTTMVFDSIFLYNKNS